MKYILITILFLFTACGGGNGDNAIQMPQEELKQDSTFKHSSKRVIIYVHGFKRDGYYRDGVYGDEYVSTFTEKLGEFTKYPTLETYNRDDSNFSVITGVEYYGNRPPNYYTPQDVVDINKTENGISRYALILAKYTKYVLEQTGAERATIVSASMGSLITRYLIENNVGNLASEKKIEGWMTMEGVVQGNYVASKLQNIENSAISGVVDSFFKQSPEVQQLKYEWVELNVNMKRDTMDKPYYDDILVGQLSFTNADKDNTLGLDYILPTHGGFQPNDGFQLVKDTYFEKVENYIQVPSHSLLHIDHVSINDTDSVYAIVSTFLEAKKRVRITLIDATVNKLYERITPSINESAEVVFANSIYSPEAMSRWGLTEPISQRVYDSGTLNIHHFKAKGEKKVFKQVLFDDFMLESESRIELEMEAFEIDRSTKYDINEVSTTSKESMGSAKVSIELKNGVYSIISDEWSGHIQVEIVEM